MALLIHLIVDITLGQSIEFNKPIKIQLPFFRLQMKALRVLQSSIS